MASGAGVRLRFAVRVAESRRESSKIVYRTEFSGAGVEVRVGIGVGVGVGVGVGEENGQIEGHVGHAEVAGASGWLAKFTSPRTIAYTGCISGEE